MMRLPGTQIEGYFAELRAASHPRVVLLRNEANEGFTRTANRGMQLSRADVVLLNSDAIVTHDWLDALRRCAASDARIATVTPFSNNAEICSYPRFCEDNPWAVEDDPEPTRRELAAAAVPTYPDLPTGVGFCMFIRRSALDEIGVFDEVFGAGYGEENDLCLRAAAAGWRNVLADDGFVAHAGARSFAGQKADLGARNLAILTSRHPHYEPMVRDYIARDPLRPLRDSARSLGAVLRHARHGLLHVIHHHGGGTESHVRALIASSRTEWRHYLAIAVDDRWQIEEHRSDGSMATFDFVRRADESWTQFGAGICGTFGIDLVHLHNISGCRDGLLEAIPATGLPFGYTVHDLNFACPTITFLAADGMYCGAQTDASVCSACLGSQPDFARVDIRQWRASHAQLLAAASFVIAPSQWAAQTLQRYFPGLPVSVIAHGLDASMPRSTTARLGVVLPDDDVPTVAVLGAIGPDKGARRLERLVELARERGARVRFVLIGYLDVQHTPWQSDDARFIVHGRYAPGDLADLLKHYRTALVLYPSAGPETFSYTLSEAWRAGYATLVPPIGALAERVAGAHGEFVMTEAQWRDEASMLDRILAIVDPVARPRLQEIATSAHGWAASSVDEMTRATTEIYQRTIGGRDAAALPRFAPERVRNALGYEAWIPPEPEVAEPVIEPSQPLPVEMPAEASSVPGNAGSRVAKAALAIRHTAVGRVLYRMAPRGAGRRTQGAPPRMTVQMYADWVARGRTHQWEGRPVDAMLCFRRALRESSRGVEALFHLGEVLWQIGRLPDAIGAWKQACESAPNFAPGLQALGEALLGVGEFANARLVADRTLELLPREPRASAVAAIAGLALGEPSSQAAHRVALVECIQRAPEVLGVPAIGGMLAVELDRRRHDDVLDALVRCTGDANAVASWPALLLALACERAAEVGARATALPALLAAAGQRTFSPAEHEALRRIAAVAQGGSGARSLASRYEQLCTGTLASPVPLLWPRRTRGSAIRVVALVAADALADPALEELRRHVRAHGGTLAVAAIGGGSAVVSEDGELRLPLAPIPDVNDARRIAVVDPDVLVDLVGLSQPSGVLLASRPARRIVTLASVRMHHLPPLVDEVAAGIDRLLEANAQRTQDDSGASADELGVVWNDAVLAHQRGDTAAASAGYARVLDLQPGHVPAHHLYGVVLRDAGNLREAADHFAAALDRAPAYVEGRSAALEAAGQLRDRSSVQMLSAPVGAESPTAVLRAAGLAWLALRVGDRASELLSVAAQREPADGETHYNHGVALQMQGRHADAARAYQRALAFRPDLVAADFNLGVIFEQLGNPAGAAAAFREVLARDPKHVSAYKNLGEILLANGEIEAWRDNFRRFEENCPDALPLAVHALEACQYLAEFAKLDAYLEGLRKERYTAADEYELADCLEQLLYLLLYFDVEPDMLHRFAVTYDETATRVYGAPLPAPAKRRPGRVRIGYLSGDFRNHVMGKMMWQAIQHHDRDRFEIRCYALSAQRDAWTEKFASFADHFESVAHLDESAAALRIAEDDLDLLVDLSTHTKGAKPGILVRKPARVQVTHVASAGTVGLASIDFKLTDHYADVPDNEATQIEALLPMKGCVYPYRQIPAAATHPFHRAALGIAPEAIVIGAFVSGLKLSRRCLTLWRTVVERVPRAQIAFSPVNAALRPLYTQLAMSAGIPADRLLFLPQGRDDAENQARYALVDFVLDPMPYGGVNGTLEALDAGVPVVTLLGKRHSERTSYSILVNANVTQTIASSGSEYVDIAVRLATDERFMREVRAAIRAGISHSPLTDMRAHARNLEAAYIEALRRKAPDVLAASHLALEA